jgi:hypothetical protein
VNWIRLALFGVVVAATVAAAIHWSGGIAVDVVIPLTLIALYLAWLFQL